MKALNDYLRYLEATKPNRTSFDRFILIRIHGMLSDQYACTDSQMCDAIVTVIAEYLEYDKENK